MSSIRSRGNLTTEWRLRSRLIREGISGWSLHSKHIFGKPDFAFEKEKIAVFVDGCFWHGCKTCRNIPTDNHDFWFEKIERNKRRDRLVNKELKNAGWHILRFWEHEVRKQPKKCIEKIAQEIKFGKS